ncbi:hypothetical protein JQC92_17225 [Shewanella sp. 202IG2-18]|uniref:hypothetical protein n=1 Tax=Parashewanella hymeniacidonis TaxID=2807618 RepID=UPI0019608A15|nr:hypothetical protein [Parashewanella hymeniacidonis]MBM7073754.1 hypothetical protein [Parashewanella hymeniacidonis]
MFRVFFSSALLILFSFHAGASEKTINHVLEQFSKSIKQKDKAAFLALFHSDNSSWVSSMSEQDFENKADVNSHSRVKEHSITKFIKWAESDKRDTEVRFTNCSIMSDSSIGIAYCDYEFFLAGKRTNFGHEAFSLIKDETDWKIVSIIFSTTIDKPSSINRSK